MRQGGNWKKTSKEYESESHWEGNCLIHPSKNWSMIPNLWERRHGPIPKGLHVCHTCDHPRCILDKHHWLGTHQDNMADAKLKHRFKSQPGGGPGGFKKSNKVNLGRVQSAESNMKNRLAHLGVPWSQARRESYNRRTK